MAVTQTLLDFDDFDSFKKCWLGICRISFNWDLSAHDYPGLIIPWEEDHRDKVKCYFQRVMVLIISMTYYH